MRYFNENKTKELREEDLDYNKGTIVEDVLIIHHEEQPVKVNFNFDLPCT